MTERSKSAPPLTGAEAATFIDARIAGLEDWRGTTLAGVRQIIHQAGPTIAETVKWGRVAVFEHDGIITTAEIYKTVVKLTFAKGASLSDPKGLFNASLDGNVRRAIDIAEGQTLDADALKALIRDAAALNASKAKPKTA